MVGTRRSEENKSQKADAKKTPRRESSRSRARKSPSRSDTRNKGPSRVQRSPKKPQAKTPASRKSPARKSPSRRSPARKSHSPAKKSAVKASPVPRKKSTERSSAAKTTSTPIIDIDTDSDSIDLYIPKVRKPQATVQGRTRRLDSEPEPAKDVDDEGKSRNFYGGIKRRSIHLPEAREADRIIHLRETFTSYEHKLSEFSDEDGVVQEKKIIDSIESRPSKKKFVVEFGGWFGSLFLILFFPFKIIALIVLCNETKCSYVPSILEPYTKLSSYLNLTAVLGFTVYALLLALLSALPLGGRKVSGFFNKNGTLNYVMNGFFAAVVIHLVLIGLELSKVPVVNFIYDKYLQLAVSSVLLGVVFSLYLYVRSFFVPISTLNPGGDTNSAVYNFFMGREISPRMFNVVDVKMFLLRMLHVSMVVLNSVVSCKSLGLNTGEFRESLDLRLLNVHPTVLTITALIYVYSLDGIMFENTWTSTFEVQHEGIGYMSSVLLFSTAFTYAVIPKYVVEYGVELSTWQLAASVTQFIIGYILYRGSNNQKYAFRRNPYSPAVSHLETIPTSQGKKLIVSGFWGFVRHPNYLGDIIMHLAFLYFVITVPPALTCLATVPVLIHRAARDGMRCKQKYEAAWDRYCQRVKYVLIPKIY